MSYFIPGLWHFAAALSWASALGTLTGGDALFWLRQPPFLAAMLLGSSALFFVPDAWSKKGLLKFLHYPLPDWDVLFLGPASHRHWLTHSPALLLLALLLAWKFPILMHTAFSRAAAGLGIGVGSHLFWDCVSARGHRIVMVPYWISLRAAASRLWLLTGATICLAAATSFAISAAPNQLNQKEAVPTTRAVLPAKTMNNQPQPRLLARGVEFPEGPSLVWNGQLLCVDIPTSRIVQVDKHKENGTATEWLNTSVGETKGNPNGSKFHNGIFYVCDSGRNQMLAINEKKEVRVIAKSPNGPNDCAFDAKGDFFFTDPNYQGQTASVYWCRAAQNANEFEREWDTVEFAAGFHFPNGVAVGADGAVYIAESGKNRIWRYERKADGSAGEGKICCELPEREDGKSCGPDGILFDGKGRLFVAHFGIGKIEVVAPDGKSLIARLEAGGANPTNLCFSADGKALYVTEAETKAIYSLDISGL